MRHGNLFVISGPSGVGKGTLVARLLNELPDAWLSISATTRKPREGETDGTHYHFITEEEFNRLVQEDGFLEWARYSDSAYGTPREPAMLHLGNDEQVILEIDVQGGFQVRERFPEAKLVFICPPSFEELERRLRGRGTEDEEKIQKRLKAAEVELSRKEEYDIQLVNDDLETATRELVAIINELAEETRG